MKIRTFLLLSLFFSSALMGNILVELNEIIKNHPEIKKDLYYYNSVKQDTKISKSYYYPSIDYLGTFGHEKVEYEKDSSQNYDGTYYKNSFSLKQNIFSGFSTEALIEQHKARLSSAAYALIDRAGDLALESIKAYLDVLKEEELTKLYEENVLNHENIYLKIKERTEAGRGRKSEVQQTESRLYLAHSNLIVQQNNLQDIYTNYHYYAGKHFDKKNIKKPSFNFNLPKNLDEASKLALQNAPSIKVMRSNVLAKKAEVKNANSEYYPKLDAVLSQEWEHNAGGVDGDKDTSSAYLMLSYNFYRGGADEAQKVKKLKEMAEENELVNKMKRDILKEIRLSYTSYVVYKKQLYYLQKHVNSAQETLNSYNEEYNLGRRDLLAILDAQKEYITARQSLLKAEYEFLYSKYRVLNALGTLPQSLNLDVVMQVDASIIKEQFNDNIFSKNSLCDNDLTPQECSNTPNLILGYN